MRKEICCNSICNISNSSTGENPLPVTNPYSGKWTWGFSIPFYTHNFCRMVKYHPGFYKMYHKSVIKGLHNFSNRKLPFTNQTTSIVTNRCARFPCFALLPSKASFGCASFIMYMLIWGFKGCAHHVRTTPFSPKVRITHTYNLGPVPNQTAKRHLNGDSIVGRQWSAYLCLLGSLCYCVSFRFG